MYIAHAVQGRQTKGDMHDSLLGSLPSNIATHLAGTGLAEPQSAAVIKAGFEGYVFTFYAQEIWTDCI